MRPVSSTTSAARRSSSAGRRTAIGGRLSTAGQGTRRRGRGVRRTPSPQAPGRRCRSTRRSTRPARRSPFSTRSNQEPLSTSLTPSADTRRGAVRSAAVRAVSRTSRASRGSTRTARPVRCRSGTKQPQLNEQAFGGAGVLHALPGQGRLRRARSTTRHVPMLDYQGDIGRQHNPIAIAQYGLARFNRWCDIAVGRRPGGAGCASARWLERHAAPNALRRAGLDAPLRLAVPAAARGALVLRPGAGQRPVAARSRGRGDRRPRLRVGGAPGLRVDAARRRRRWRARHRRRAAGSGSRSTWSIRPATSSTASSGRSGASTTTRAGAATLTRGALLDTRASTRSRARCPSTTPAAGRSTNCPPAVRRCSRARYYHRLHIVQLRVMERLTGRPCVRRRRRRAGSATSTTPCTARAPSSRRPRSSCATTDHAARYPPGACRRPRDVRPAPPRPTRGKPVLRRLPHDRGSGWGDADGLRGSFG